MDVETSHAIESLRHDLERGASDLAERMAVMDTSLRRQIATTGTTLRAGMRETREELSRNAAILTEGVRDDIRIVADGLAALSAQIDGLRR